MTTEIVKPVVDPAGVPAGDPPAGGTPLVPKVDPPLKDPKVTPATPPAGGTPDPKKPKTLGDDEEIPDGEEMLQMSPRALSARLARSSRKQLQDAFGTADIGEIKKLVEKAKAAEVKEEEERKSRLTAEEKLKEERDEHKRRADAAEVRAEEAEKTRIIEREDRRVTSIAEKHIKAKHIPKFLPDLARALLKATKRNDPALKKNENKWIDGWFAKVVKDEPEFGKDFTATPPDPAKTKLLGSGVDPTTGRPNQQPSGTLTTKTARPGQPNSLTDREIREQGYTYK